MAEKETRGKRPAPAGLPSLTDEQLGAVAGDRVQRLEGRLHACRQLLERIICAMQDEAIEPEGGE